MCFFIIACLLMILLILNIQSSRKKDSEQLFILSEDFLEEV